MRIKAALAISLAAVAILPAVAALTARAQRILTPDASAAKAKQLVQQAIETLGGQAYLSAHDETCEGRVAIFGHHDAVNDYERVENYYLFPDKERSEYSILQNIIDVYNGDQGWSLDRGGVSEMPASSVADFQASLKRNINNLFRFHLKDPGIVFSYVGHDVVDLKEADWVEIDDADNLTTRIAIGSISHLPITTVFSSRDPVTRDRTEQTESFSNYQPINGIETPFQVTRSRDGQKTFQFFISSCHYNTGLSPDFFTRQSLEERWAKLGHHHK